MSAISVTSDLTIGQGVAETFGAENPAYLIDASLGFSLPSADLALSPLSIGTNTFTVDAGEDLDLTLPFGSLVKFTGVVGGGLINNGSLSLTSSGPAQLISITNPLNTVVVVRNNGSISLNAQVGGFGVGELDNYGSVAVTTTSIAVGPSGTLINGGSLTVTATPDRSGDDTIAYGVQLGATALVQNLASGTITVSAASGAATGVSTTFGGEFDNAGTIAVTGGSRGTLSNPSAIGLSISFPDLGLQSAYATIDNSGSLTVSGGGAIGIRVGVVGSATPYHGPGPGEYNLVNSGTITATTAIQFMAGGGVSNPGERAAIDNSGVINGTVLLSEQDDRLVNTGTINGNVNLGNGADTLDSHSGTINGSVTFGSGSSTATLGAENNAVILGAGVHVVDGGGGANTASYAAAGGGVTVNLALQGQAQNTSVGVDTLSHFQNLTGSAFNDHLTGDAGDNVIDGGGGNDVLDGGGGVNTVSFASTTQSVTVSLALQGHAQNTGVGSETLSNFQNLTGSAFNDKLEGGGSASSLTGGAGADTFVDHAGDGAVTITDFSHAQGDKIDLSSFIQFGSLADVLAASTQVGADTLINTASGSLTLKNVQLANLTANDFVLAATPGSGLHIHVNYDASVSDAPATFFVAVQKAVEYFQNTFTNPITVDINVGWGEVGGQAVDPYALAESIFNYDTLSYQAVKDALVQADGWSNALSNGIASLGGGPGGNSSFAIATAEEKAWGLTPSTAVDGYVGVSSSDTFTFDPINRAVPGAFDIVGGLEHEISEILGRVVLAGYQADPSGPSYFTALDLFRYAQPNIHDYTAGPASFSMDGNQLLKAFNDSRNGGDAGDWATSSMPDSFDAFGSPGVEADVSPVDISVLQALGYTVKSTAFGRFTSDFGGTGQDDLLFRNPTTGDWGFMQAGNEDSQTWHPIGPSAPDYAPIGRGDFDGDGTLDTAFRQTSTGNWGYMTIGPTGGETWHAVGVSSTAYAAIAAGDILGDDGAFDIVFRNPTTGDWGFMQVGGPGGSQTWHPIGSSSPDYAPIGYGDFNGDGIFDVAFRQVSTGDWGYLSINPGGGETWRPVGPSSTTYAAIGSGDFLGDGTTQIAFRNPTTGDWGFMQTTAGGAQVWHPAGPSSTDYSVLGVGDFNGDGLQDVAFRQNTTGDWGYLTVNAGGETWHHVGLTSLDYLAV